MKDHLLTGVPLLCLFAENGIRPEHVYGGAHGAISQLQALESWFEVQREFHFYSSSVLILYEGGATGGPGLLAWQGGCVRLEFCVCAWYLVGGLMFAGFVEYMMSW